jgi:fructokinase
LASGIAVERRWGRPATELADDETVWELEAHYLALGLIAVICILSPQRIILGGGVMTAPDLLPRIHREVKELLGGYVESPAVGEGMADYIVLPALGLHSGVLGAIALASMDGAI